MESLSSMMSLITSKHIDERNCCVCKNKVSEFDLPIYQNLFLVANLSLILFLLLQLFSVAFFLLWLIEA